MRVSTKSHYCLLNCQCYLHQRYIYVADIRDKKIYVMEKHENWDLTQLKVKVPRFTHPKWSLAPAPPPSWKKEWDCFRAVTSEIVLLFETNISKSPTNNGFRCPDVVGNGEDRGRRGKNVEVISAPFLFVGRYYNWKPWWITWLLIPPREIFGQDAIPISSSWCTITLRILPGQRYVSLCSQAILCGWTVCRDDMGWFKQWHLIFQWRFWQGRGM